MGLVAALFLTGCGSEAQYRAGERLRLARVANTQMQNGDTDAALAALDEALGLAPDVIGPPPTHVDLLLMKADILDRVDRTDEAWESLERAHSFDPLRTEVVSGRVRRELDAGDLDAAVAILDDALARNPLNFTFRMQLGLLLLGQDDFERAETEFQQAADLMTMMRATDDQAPLPTPAWLGLAVIRGREDPAAGLDDFLRAIESGDTDTVSMLDELLSSGNAQTLMALSRLGAEERPSNASVGRIYALMLLSTGDPSGCEREVERLLGLDPPPDEDARMELLMIGAKSAQVAGDGKKIFVWFRRALDEDETRLELLEALAVLTLQSGAAPADLADLKDRIARATLAIEDPAKIAMLEQLARRVEELTNR